MTFSIRLYFAYQTPYLSDTESYFHLRQVEHIKETGLPLFTDPLSYGGRRYVFLPFYHYVIAAFSFLLPLSSVVKILPNLLASSLIFVVYLCSLEITKRREYALFSAIVSAFIPIYFVETFNSLETYALTIPLSFLLLYAFFQIAKKPEQEKNGNQMKNQYTRVFLFFLVILLITSASVAFIILSLVAFYFISKLENLKTEQEEVEIILFSVLLTLWFYFLVFKNAFLDHGTGIVWQNIPQKILNTVFHQVSVIEGVAAVGLVPFCAGIYIVYLNIFKKKSRPLYLIISILLTITALLWLKLISFKLGLMYISVLLIFFFGEAYKLFMSYIERTKAHRYKILFSVTILLIFVITSFLPLMSLTEDRIENTITKDEVAALIFLRENTRPDQRIAAPIEEGNYIAYFAQRKNVADTNFLQVRDASIRLEKLDTLFNTRSKIIANNIIGELDAQLIYLSKRSQKEFEIEDLAAGDEQCFPPLLLYHNVKVYRNRCSS